jgi:hypothetical protein
VNKRANFAVGGTFRAKNPSVSDGIHKDGAQGLTNGARGLPHFDIDLTAFLRGLRAFYRLPTQLPTQMGAGCHETPWSSLPENENPYMRRLGASQ